MKKKCRVCENILPIEDFYFEHGRCKKCLNKIRAEIRKNKPKKKKIKIIKAKKINDKVRIRAYQNEWRRENKDKINLYKRNYRNRRLKNNPLLRLGENIRNRMYKEFKEQDLRKQNHSNEYLGCSFGFLKSYIESLWVEGMNWGNWGRYVEDGPPKWHIDHIIPVTYFDLSKEEEAKKCFHYSNLRPIWADDNISKLDKIYFKIDSNFEYPKSEHSYPQNPDRIPRILNKILFLKEKFPELRVLQIIENSLSLMKKEKKIDYDIDNFYVSDDDLELGLDKFLELNNVQ
jgi:hypothetical protein